MILRSPEFEKRMRARLKEAFQKSPELRKERRKASRLARRNGSLAGARLFWLLIAVSLLGAYITASDSVLLGSAAVSLWAAGSAFKLALTLLGLLYASMDIYVFHHLPINHGQIFQIQSRKFFSAAAWTLAEFACAYFVLTLLAQPSAVRLLEAIVIGVFQGCLISALAIHLAARFPHLPLGAVGGILRTSAVFLLFCGGSFAEALPDIAFLIDLSNPAGWVNYIYRQAVLLNAAWMLALLIPLGAIIWLARGSWNRLRAAYYSLDEMELELSHDSPDGSEPSPDAAAARRKGLTEMTDEIRSGAFKNPALFDQAGWLEKICARLWTPREKIAAELLLGSAPNWSRVHHRTAVILAICALALMLAGEKGQLILFVAGYILVTSAYSLFSSEWRGLQTARGPGGFIPFYSYFPITYAEVVKTIWKANFVRWVAAGPFFIAFSAFGGWISGQTALNGLDLGLRIYFLLLAIQPLLIFSGISSGTNDSSRPNLRSAIFMLLLLIPIWLAILSLAIGLFILEPVSGAAFCLAVIFCLSLASLGLQWVGYRRGWFDLVSNYSAKSNP
jgi:hypothetical protein